MIKRTLCFEQEAYLSVRAGQLVVRYPNDQSPERTVPIEDIGVVVLEHYRITLSHSLLSRLLSNNVAVITTDAQHLPQGLLLNLNGHHMQQLHFSHQIAMTSTLKNKLWQQTIKAKIRNQLLLLQQQGIATDSMHYWSKQVRSGDPENLEGRAAAYYWKHLFGIQTNFIRDRDGTAPNNWLNYGYAILRALVARSLTASGLLPTLGIHHHNRYNAYCLADDIMEPYRPYVDQLIVELLDSYPEEEELTPEIKRALLQIPVIDVVLGKKAHPLMVAVQQTTASLYECITQQRTTIQYPILHEHATL